MPLPFLDVVPREIRDQIYTYVLASPSGAVKLTPWTVAVARSLSILQTCKQVHRECKDIIWLHNGLRLREPTQLSQSFQKLGMRRLVASLPPMRLYKAIRHIDVVLELLDRDELEWMLSALKGLEDWCRMGSLESITLSTGWERPRDIGEFKEVLTMRRSGERVDGRLYTHSITATASLTRIAIHTGWPQFSHWGKQSWLKAMLLDPSGIDELLREIHAFFKGKLYVNDVLCFSSGKQLFETCRLDPRNGEVKIFPDYIDSL